MISDVYSEMVEQNTVVNHLTAQQAYDYMDKIMKNDNLFNLIRESFQLKFDITKGVAKDEMTKIFDAIADPDLKCALNGITIIGESKTVLAFDNTQKRTYRKTLVYYDQRNDGKYDILIVYATQTKELAVDKLIACGLGSLCAGIAAGVITKDVTVGVATGAVLAASSGAKAAYDYCKEMKDALCGYILEESVQKRLLSIKAIN